MFEVQENVSERSVREFQEKLERERVEKRAQTVGELIDALAQNDYDYPNRYKMKEVLCSVLNQAAEYYAGNENAVCRGALVIAASAIQGESGRFVPTYLAERLTNYIKMLANEMLEARGAGYASLEVLAALRTIAGGDSDGEDFGDWPSHGTR
jgi:hypothetical protein